MHLSRRIGLMGIALLLLTAPLRAEEAVVCLQEQLAELGYDPGPADGRVGPATRSALERYEAAEGAVAERSLDAFSAIIFCRELGVRDASLREHWPSFGRRLRVEVAGVPDDEVRAALVWEANAGMAKLEGVLGVQLAAPVDIVFGTRDGELAERAMVFSPSSDGAVGRFATRLCRNAPGYGVAMTHMPGVILVCQRPGVVYHGGFDTRDFRNRLGEVLAMEMVAQLTGDPANGSDDDYYRRTGPMWLLVGTMQLLQREVDGVITPLGRQRAVEKLRSEGITHPRRMKFYQSSLEDAAGIGRTGLLVTDDLTRETGLRPIGVFYRLLGTGLTVDDAFEQAFGKTLDAVYEGYP